MLGRRAFLFIALFALIAAFIYGLVHLFNLRFEVILPVFEGDDAEILHYHKENLLLCDAVLIYYGNGSHLWVQSKLTDLRKALGWGRARPITAAVLIGPPASEAKERFRTHEAEVIKEFGEFSPETLRPFVEAIRQIGNGNL